jgi:hypothetical protein
MTPEQFTYWLQGFVEMCGEMPTEEQWDMIKEHLQLVFDKKTIDFNKWPGAWSEPVMRLYVDNPDLHPKITC